VAILTPNVRGSPAEKPLRQQCGRGFSLVEVLIAMLIVGAGVVPVLALFLSGSRTVEKGGVMLKATIIAQNILDRAKSDSFIWDNAPIVIELPDAKFPQFQIPEGFTKKYKAKVTLAIDLAPNHTVIGTGDKETNLWQVSVLINWTENQIERTHRLLTYRGNTNSFALKTSTRF
jgi:prepilin-type N-terminal cleavage/methylation domain-containing protein